MIDRVTVVLNRTVVVDSDWRFDNLCGSHLQSQSELYNVSCWYLTLVIGMIGQLSRDVIGHLSVKPWWPYWLWRLLNVIISSRFLLRNFVLNTHKLMQYIDLSETVHVVKVGLIVTSLVHFDLWTIFVFARAFWECFSWVRVLEC